MNCCNFTITTVNKIWKSWGIPNKHDIFSELQVDFKTKTGSQITSKLESKEPYF